MFRGKEVLQRLDPFLPTPGWEIKLFNRRGLRGMKSGPFSLLIEYREAKINLGRDRSCWQQRFLTCEERILFTGWGYKADEKHSLSSSSENIKTHHNKSFLHGRISYIWSCQKPPLYTEKGTTLYTKKEYYKTNSRTGKINEHLRQRLGIS